MTRTTTPTRSRRAYRDDGVPAPLLPWQLGWEADGGPLGADAHPSDGETPCAGFDPYAPLTRRVVRGTGGAW